MPLSEADSKNFDILCCAIRNGDVALMDVQRKSDGKSVAAVCAVGRDSKENYYFTPFAIMVEGNPFELFNPPNEVGDGYAVGPALEMKEVQDADNQHTL